jgi:RHS repeat-associated protein
LSGSLEGGGGIGGLLATYDVDDSKSYIYFYDANGNVGQLVDRSDGSLDARYEYDAYGNTIASAGDYADDNPLRFSTKYFDGELDYAETTNDGLYYFGYRYYSPRLGRWSNRDLVGELAGYNLFTYVGNGPQRAVDPFGLTEKDCVYPEPPPLEEKWVPSTQAASCRHEVDIWNPWTRWLCADEDGYYQIDPNCRWGRVVRGLVTTGLLERKVYQQLKHRLGPDCADCCPEWPDKKVSLSGNVQAETTWTRNKGSFLSIGGLRVLLLLELEKRAV